MSHLPDKPGLIQMAVIFALIFAGVVALMGAPRWLEVVFAALGALFGLRVVLSERDK